MKKKVGSWLDNLYHLTDDQQDQHIVGIITYGGCS